MDLAFPRARTVVIPSLVLAGWLFAEIYALDRDPPHWMAEDVGVFVDEGLKSLCARNLAVFGSCKPVAGDLYRGGGAAGATALQSSAFAALGPTPMAARVLSVVAGAAALLALWTILPAGGRNLAVVLLAADPLFAVFSRLGLVELLWIAPLLLAITVVGSSWNRCIAAGALFAAACSAKPAAVACAPVLLTAAWSAGGAKTLLTLSTLGATAALATIAALGLGRFLEVASIALPAVHHALEVPQAAGSAMLTLLTSDPFLYAFAVWGYAETFFGDASSEPTEHRAGLLGIVWLACGLVAAILAGFAVPPARYLAHLPFALALGAAVALSRFDRRRIGRGFQLSVGALAVGWSVLGGAGGFTGPTTLADARRWFQQIVDKSPEGVLVSGLWAPTIAFETRAPVLVTCAGCSFPPPGGAEGNLALLEQRLRSTSGGRVLLVAAEETGEASFWERHLHDMGLGVEVRGRFEVGGHGVKVLGRGR